MPSVTLPLPAPSPQFEETQWFYRRWWWLWLGLSILLVAPLGWALTKPNTLLAVLITAPIMVLGVVGLWLLRLTVRIDAEGIHYQYFPLLYRWRHWPWQEFRRVAPRTYSPLGDYGGWGIRGLPGNLAYNVWGPAGLQLVFQSGNKLLLGTQRPAELQATLAALQAAFPTGPIALEARS